MSLHRPLVSVYALEKQEVKSQIALPDVFLAPIRTDIVNDIHSKIMKNHRQSYAVNRYAGLQTAAASWGTGRAVSRIPRVPGGGTHRAGQGAFGNMCRGGRLFSPTKTWRRWCHKIQLQQKRFATASALSASSEVALVQARGHIVDGVAELPLVVSDDVQSTQKTKDAVKILKYLGVYKDVLKVQKSKKLHVGKGKRRNRRWQHKLGPLVIYNNDSGVIKAFRNIRGVDLCNVHSLNLLKLAPGGQVGRLIIWTESAFKELNNIFGSYGAKGATSTLVGRHKLTYKLPQASMINTDISRIIQSDAIQSVIRDRKIHKKRTIMKVNPLKNKRVMLNLNPNAK